MSQIQSIIRANEAVRASGFAHSWNPFMCPNKTGVVIKMQEIRGLKFENNKFIAGSGTSMGSLVNFMMKYGQELPSFWVSDISIGGAVATGVHNDGIGFFECCVEKITMVNGLGNILEISKNDTMWKFIPGSIGRIGIIAEVVITGQPLSKLQYVTTKTSWYSTQHIIDAIHSFNQSSTLWITHDKIIQQDKHVIHEQAAPNTSYSYFPFLYIILSFFNAYNFILSQSLHLHFS